MFKFGFSEEKDHNTQLVENTHNNTNQWLESKEIEPNKNDKIVKRIVENGKTGIIQCNDYVKLSYITSTSVLDVLRDTEYWSSSSIFNAEENHSDLLTTIYEGGLKIWECTYDLVNYIYDVDIPVTGKNILDLGCGAGIVGLSCVAKGSSSCTFQDYNSEVIKYVTIPNVILNSEEYLTKSKFFCGDWKSFADILSENIVEENKFDYIFTSETIYNTDTYSKLNFTFKNLLKKNGVIFLAAKSYYFGVGGGISLFKEYLNKENIFQYSSCWRSCEGVKREILEIRFKT